MPYETKDDGMRAAFEDAAQAKGMSVRKMCVGKNPNCYLFQGTEIAWEMWQAAQSAMRVDEAMPSYWCAIGTQDDEDAGEIVIAYSTDDGNNGEAARTECNQYINDGVKLHLVPLYTRAALQAAIGGKELA